MDSFTEAYGENYLACAVLVSAKCYEKYTKKEKVDAGEIILDVIREQEFEVTEEGVKLIKHTVEKTMKEVNNIETN